MNLGPPLTFDLPPGWTLRKVATTLARMWLPPFRAVPVAKRAPWLVQPIVEESGKAGSPLWEPGISTQEYEERLDQSGLCWAIRAKTGRSSGTVLARFVTSDQNPKRFHLLCSLDSFPETLFDADLITQFLEAKGSHGADGLFAGLLIENGFRPATA